MSFVSSLIGAGISGLTSALSSSARADAAAAAAPVPVNLSEITSGQNQFVNQGYQLPSVAALLSEAAKLDNQDYQDRLSSVDATILERVKRAGELALRASKGELTADQLARINEDAAYKALNAGTAFSGTAAADKERATELARLQTISEAPSMLSTALPEAKALNPSVIDVGSTLISPAAITARDNAVETRNNQIENQERAIRASVTAANQSSLFGGIGRAAGGILGNLDSIGNGVSNLLGLPQAGVTSGYSSLGR